MTEYSNMVDVLFDIFGLYRVDPPIENDDNEVKAHAVHED